MAEQHFQKRFFEAQEIIEELYSELKEKERVIDELKEEIRKLKPESPASPTKKREKKTIRREEGQENLIIVELKSRSQGPILMCKWAEEDDIVIGYHPEQLIEEFEPELRGFMDELKRKKSKQLATLKRNRCKILLDLLK